MYFAPPNLKTWLRAWNKADCTLNKNHDLLLACLKLDLWIKNALCFEGVLSAWFHFQWQCELCHRTAIYHAWRFCDGFFAFNCCEKHQNKQYFEKEHCSKLSKHFRRQLRYIEKRSVFLSRSPTFFMKRTSLFSGPKVPCKIQCTCTLHVRFTTFTPLLLLRKVVRDSYSFFLFLILTWGEVFLV